MTARSRRRRDLVLASVLTIFWVAFFIFNFILKGSYIFEGQLTVRELSFTYNGDLEKPLLQNVTNIKKLDIAGKRSQSLTLKGKFTSEDRNLDRQLSSLNKINIEFPNTSSRLILSPQSLDSEEFAISELRMNPETRINKLTYDRENQLSFCLQSANLPSENCLFSENIDNNANSTNSKPLGNLTLSFGKESYLINLERVNIPALNITSDPNNYKSLSLKYIPQTKEPQLNIFSPTRIFIDLQKKATSKTDRKIENFAYFYEDIDVTDANFYRFKQSSNVADEIPLSTIISGKIRMNGKDIELKNNQFLIIKSDRPGIRKLRYLTINAEQQNSLQTFISGKSKGIAVGLYPQFPIESIKPSWLAKYFPTELIAAILSFISAFTAVFLEKIIFPDNP